MRTCHSPGSAYLCRKNHCRRHRQRGFSLIEFMIAATISLGVVLAASMVYLNSRQTQVSLSEKSSMFEGARVVMDIIGRDLENAGFYPAEESPGSGVKVSVLGYQNPCLNPRNSSVRLCKFSNPTPFNTGVFGCAGQRLTRSGSANTTAYACAAQPTGISANDGDSLVVNYYTMDSASLNVGQRADCENEDVANDAINIRPGDTPSAGNPNRLTYDQPKPSTLVPTIVPALPLFVSNRYTLTVGSDIQIEGRTLNTFNMACDGNGNDNDASASTASTASPMVTGIEQLKFKYMVRTTGGQSQYLAASAVTNWTAVVAVRVCVLAHSLQNTQAGTYTIADCNATDRTFADGRSRKLFTQVFVLKNASLD